MAGSRVFLDASWNLSLVFTDPEHGMPHMHAFYTPSMNVVSAEISFIMPSKYRYLKRLNDILLVRYPHQIALRHLVEILRQPSLE